MGKKAAESPKRPHDSAGPARHSHTPPVLRPPPKISTDEERAFDTPSQPPSTYTREAAATAAAPCLACDMGGMASQVPLSVLYTSQEERALVPSQPPTIMIFPASAAAAGRRRGVVMGVTRVQVFEYML